MLNVSFLLAFILATLLGLALFAIGFSLGLMMKWLRAQELAKTETVLDLFSVIDHSNVGYAIADDEGRLIYTSNSFLSMACLSKENNMLNKHWFRLDLASDGLKARRQAEWKQVVRARKNWHGILRWKIGPRRRKFFEATLKYMAPNRWAFIIQDRSLQIESRRQMANQEALTHFLLNNLPLIVTLQHPDGRFLFVTENFAERLGLPISEILGKRPAEIPTFVVTERVQQLFAHAVISGQPLNAAAIEITEGAFKDTHWLYYITPLVDSEGYIDRVLTVSVEMTDKVRLQQERQAFADKLIELQKIEAMNRFAAGLAHEVSNIIHPVGVYARALVENPDIEKRQTYLRQINQAILAAGELLHKTKDMTKPYSEPVDNVDIVALARDLLELINDLNRGRDPIRSTLPEKSVFVRASKTGLRQVLLNLINNALDATEQGGAIYLEIGEAEEAESPPDEPFAIPCPYIFIRVRDEGIGMDQDVQEQIFDTFFTTKKDNMGTGLGLAFVRNLIASWDGQINIKSELGDGASFTVWLPKISKALENGVMEELDGKLAVNRG